MPRPEDFDPANKTDATKCLVPIRVRVPAGEPIYLATFANHLDEETIAAYTAATPSLTLTTSPGADDDTNGALVYIYSGPGKGGINVSSDYVHSTKVMTLHRQFATAPTTASKCIVLEGEGGGVGGMGFFSRTELATVNTVNIANGYDDGDWMFYLDFRDAAKYLDNLTVPIIRASAIAES